MISSLVAMYQKGAITADHLVIECLQRIDPKDPAPVLGGLPREIIIRMTKFIHYYRTGRMVTNYGAQPAVDQVEAARKWIEANGPDQVEPFEPDGLLSVAWKTEVRRGSPTPPWAGPKVSLSLRPATEETFGRARGKVGRPGHN